ncbi:MAG: hypothetical protein Q8Q95_03010 [bacterium]|nr:hypothetical protein [bacterium]
MFNKWDIIFVTKFPEIISCSKCNRPFSILDYPCQFCGNKNIVTNIIAKPRPAILWLDQVSWFKSMAFAIPLSKSGMIEDRFNEIIKISDYTFLHSDITYRVPMRAVICQATRIDGNVLSQNKLIGKITDTNLMNKIENKLLNWVFG